MIIHDIADYLVNLTCRDIKPDIYSVFDSSCENKCTDNVGREKLTILEILNAIGCRLKNLFGFVKINTTTETIEDGEAVVNVSGDVDNLNFDFKIPNIGKTGPAGPAGPAGPKGDTGPAGPGVVAGGTTGQILVKKSNANYDTEWIDNTGGGGSTFTKTILWQNNNSPSKGFEKQTITTTENGFNYPLLIIEFVDKAGGANKLSAVATNTTRYGTNSTLLSYYNGYRTVRTETGKSWTVGAGFNISTNTTDNNVVIPLNIIGYK